MDKTILTIAGFDGSGGAGIQADLKTFAALNCYGLSVLTAIPIQSTSGVKNIYPLSEKCVHEQLQALLEDIQIDAVKIGMLHRKEIVQVVAEFLKSLQCPIVIDPVMHAKSGHSLLSDEGIQEMQKSLFPLTTLLTPNLSEASFLLKRKIITKDEMEKAAIDLGLNAVVIKGGHLMGETCDDCLYVNGEISWLKSPRILSKNTHGTGCTFSSAIAAFLAQGNEISEAVSLAKDYLYQTIEAAIPYQIGKGNGPLHHFFAKASKPCSKEQTSFK